VAGGGARAGNDSLTPLPTSARFTGGGSRARHPHVYACFSLDPTPDTLHPTPYTLHPTPYTLHPKRGYTCQMPPPRKNEIYTKALSPSFGVTSQTHVASELLVACALNPKP